MTPETRDVSFYRVPFACTVPGLGCGPLAKPVLLELERSPFIGSAWLHRLGTTMATVWAGSSARESRHELINTAMRGRTFAELTGSDREGAEKSFRAGQYWYRGREVDRLTEEEARVIAFGLVRETTTMVALAEDQAGLLELALTGAIRDRLVNATIEQLGPGWLLDTLERWLTNGGQTTSDAQRAALRQAVNRRISR